MKCNKCQIDMGVVDSRKYKDNRTYRRYNCPKCGQRITTTELPVNEDSSYWSNSYVRITREFAEKFIQDNGWFSRITGKTYATKAEALEATYKGLIFAKGDVTE